ncbi:hypothetical protein D1872_322310 [compost metagenome]
MSVEASTPTICAPSTIPDPCFATILMYPSAALSANALPLIAKEALPMTIGKAFSFASVSLRPTLASSGSEKTTSGMAL